MELLAIPVIILLLLCGLGSFVCWILTLVKIFKSEGGVVHGIIGIICGIWAFIYGWMKADELENRKVMMIWTLCFVGSIALQVVAGVLGGIAGAASGG